MPGGAPGGALSSGGLGRRGGRGVAVLLRMRDRRASTLPNSPIEGEGTDSDHRAEAGVLAGGAHRRAGCTRGGGRAGCTRGQYPSGRRTDVGWPALCKPPTRAVLRIPRRLAICSSEKRPAAGRAFPSGGEIATFSWPLSDFRSQGKRGGASVHVPSRNTHTHTDTRARSFSSSLRPPVPPRPLAMHHNSPTLASSFPSRPPAYDHSRGLLLRRRPTHSPSPYPPPPAPCILPFHC